MKGDSEEERGRRRRRRRGSEGRAPLRRKGDMKGAITGIETRSLMDGGKEEKVEE